MEEYLIRITTAVVVAIISAWITVKLSLRRFRSEKWWELKVQTYQNVIEALHNSKLFADEHLEAGYNFREVSDERDKELRQKAKAGHEELGKIMDIGAFMLSEEATARLQRYRKEAKAAGEEPDWVGYLEADYAALDNCLKDFIEIARRDLGTK
jgi:hypothetical protein